MRIGFPRGLLFYYYYPLWKTMFEELGMEVVVSQPTSVHLMNKGVKVAVPEICVPMKVYSGHVLDLLEKDVDYIFIPRMVSIEKEYSFCPKFIGLPDMLCYTIPGLREKLLAPTIINQSEAMDSIRNYRQLEQSLHVSRKELKKALQKGTEEWKKYRDYSRRGYTLDEALSLWSGELQEEEISFGMENDITIGVIGYVYNLYDPLISMNMVKKLRKMNVNLVTFEMVDEKHIENKVDSVHKAMFWTFTNKLWGSADHLYKQEEVDGLVHLTAFGCGPDSLLGKLMDLESTNYGKPFMTIRVDEHTGENHLDTRMEAFIDMLRRKKTLQGRVSNQ